MPKFRVKGCFKDTAEDVEIILEATSYKDAQRIANQKGILVSDVLVAEESSRNDSGPAVPSSALSESKLKSVEEQKNVLLPHRGSLILTFGLATLFCGCFPLGIIAWIFANHDIKAMKSGEMNSGGMGKTKAGKLLSIISLALALMVLIVAVADPVEPTANSNSSNRSKQKAPSVDYGSASDERRKAREYSISGEMDLIGKWLDLTPYLGGEVVIYIKNGKTYKKNMFQDGSVRDREVVESTSQLGRRFDDVGGSAFGDHWIIDSKGNLQCWDDEGWISTAQPK